MFYLLILEKGLDGEASGTGVFYDLLLFPAPGNVGAQIYCGSSTSIADAKTLAGDIFQASLSWTDSASGSQSAVFTS